MGYGPSMLSSTRFEQLPNQGSTGIASASCTASSIAGSYGTAVNVGTSSFDYDGLIFHYLLPTGGGRDRWTVTYNNTGTDEPLITDLLLDVEQSGNSGWQVFCPLVVPKGSLVKAKVACTTASRNRLIVIQGFQGDGRMTRGFRQMMSATDFSGFDPANSITLNGTTPTAWQTAMAVTPTRFAALMVSPDTLAASATIPQLRLDFAIGPSGSEQPLGFSTFYAFATAGPAPNVQGPFPCDIPAGSRIAYRGACSAANTTTISVSLCGFAA
jgi:hypothetical protein